MSDTARAILKDLAGLDGLDPGGKLALVRSLQERAQAVLEAPVRPRRMTPDLVMGKRLLKVSLPVAVPPSNNLYREAIQVGALVTDTRTLGPGSMVMKMKDGSLRRFFTKRALTTKAKNAKKAIVVRLLAAGFESGPLVPPNTPLYARLWFHMSPWTKSGDIRIEDVGAREKLILDTVADYFHLQRPLRKKGGDEAIFFLEMKKVEDRVKGFTLELGVLEKDTSWHG